MYRQYSLVDHLFTQMDTALSAIFGQKNTKNNPASAVAEVVLSPEEIRKSAGFMRVNHTGEVCAQALYEGQLVFAQKPSTRSLLEQSREEEQDHLSWTATRLQELGAHRSYLNIVWYLNAYLLGFFAGLAGDDWSLAFVEETEAQVTRHLEGHLKNLSAADLKSRAIVEKMREDEMHHGQLAQEAGAKTLPTPVKKLMQLQAKVMTILAYYI